MTKKHFVAIAEATRYKLQYTPTGDARRELVDYVTECLTPILVRSNERFDKRKFWNACGITADDLND